MCTYILHRREFNKANITRPLPSSENNVWKSAIMKEVTQASRGSPDAHISKSITLAMLEQPVDSTSI